MYLKSVRYEISNAVNCLKKFVEIVLSTGDQGQLQLLSDLALKHVIDAEKHCKVCKEEMEQNRSDTLIRLRQLESNIQMHQSILLHTTSLIKLNETDISSLEVLTKDAKFRHIYILIKYLALYQQSSKQRCDLVGINILIAVFGLGMLIKTAGTATPLVIFMGLQSGVTIGSSIAYTKAVKKLNSAKYENRKCNNKLYEYSKEKTKLVDKCVKLQNKYDLCRQKQQAFQEEHSVLVERLSQTTTMFECLFNCRHFISILQGRIEVLQEARKNIAFQNDLRLPLQEINDHLASVFNLDLLKNSETSKFCQHFSEQLMLLPKSSITLDIDDDSI